MFNAATQFEKLVVDKIKEHILTPDNLQKLVSLVNEEMDAASSDCRQRLSVVMDEIADANCRLERLYEALETGKVQYRMVGHCGLEPQTPVLSGLCSDRLS